MDESRQGELRAGRVLGILCGIRAGVAGAGAILVLMAVWARAGGEPWWTYPNVLATVFYGGRALRAGFGWETVSGAAIQVLVSGVAGAVFGALFGWLRGGGRLILLGVIWGIGWYYCSAAFLGNAGRLIPVYTSEIALLGAHTVFGLILGRAARVSETEQEGTNSESAATIR